MYIYIYVYIHMYMYIVYIEDLADALLGGAEVAPLDQLRPLVLNHLVHESGFDSRSIV